MGFGKRLSRFLVRIFAALGAVFAVLLVSGVVLDLRAFDQTRGGYEPPYTGFTGEPIDWSQLDVSASGMVYRGHVLNVLINCTSGMVHFEIYKLQIPFRTVSPRAIAVHKPREACAERGFRPAF